ncbi:MAG: hypothetical protein ABIK39_03395 [candidate division WOR-3 bacterium]
MFKNAALICLVGTGLAVAGPAMRIGTKATWRPDYGFSGYYDTTGKEVARVSYGAPFVGATIEACYGPVYWFSGRLDLAQFQIFTNGVTAFKLFPMLGLDILVEPPLNWRLKPYLWGGARITSYSDVFVDNNPPTFPRDSEMHYRAGIGMNFKLTPRLELFGETQFFADDTWWEGVTVFPDGFWFGSWSGIQGLGFCGAELGVRLLIPQ